MLQAALPLLTKIGPAVAQAFIGAGASKVVDKVVDGHTENKGGISQQKAPNAHREVRTHRASHR